LHRDIPFLATDKKEAQIYLMVLEEISDSAKGFLVIPYFSEKDKGAITHLLKS
jgi:hypothetical protein